MAQLTEEVGEVSCIIACRYGSKVKKKVIRKGPRRRARDVYRL